MAHLVKRTAGHKPEPEADGGRRRSERLDVGGHICSATRCVKIYWTVVEHIVDGGIAVIVGQESQAGQEVRRPGSPKNQDLTCQESLPT